GWAIVDNTTSEDWTKVRLALVSGRPISFISRLYEPRYIQRATAELPEDVALRPVVYEGSMDALKESEQKTASRKGVGGGSGGGTFMAPKAMSRELPMAP